VLGDLPVLRQERRRNEGSLFRVQRSKIHCDEWSVSGARPPALIERILLEPGSHDQHRRTVGDGRRELGQLPEGGGLGPVQVFDRQHTRRNPARMLDQPRHRPAPSFSARAVVHRVVERAQGSALRQP
jgi:hypothetical protein